MTLKEKKNQIYTEITYTILQKWEYISTGFESLHIMEFQEF